ncbi:unnamed protein product [Orchesella dallaii]|uniref:BPTI/Kunitz inhibitor domain-containing protein n=1 Tax=Orchesella dallaii TaxID=48710 RepID=A0ABP1QBG2_9HEXA
MSYYLAGKVLVIVLVIANVSTSTLPLDSPSEIDSNGYGLFGQSIRRVRQASNNICLLPPITPGGGFCLASFRMFTFNVNSRNCESYIYGGCGGTKNLFETKDACEKACGGRF